MTRWCCAASATLAASAVAATASAAPITGASHTSSVFVSPSYVYFLTPGGALDGGLTAAGCPFLPEAPDAEARTSTLAVRLDGWYGPIQNPDTNPSQQVDLRGHASGTVQDAAGNIYNAAGNFLDSSTHDLFANDLLFDGIGVMTLVGPRGMVTGEAELRVVSGPLEFAFTFTNIRQCNIRLAG